MYGPPPDPRDRPIPDNPTWRGILVSYVAIAVIPLALWVVSQPLAGTVVLAGIVGLFVGARRAYRLARCFYDCQGFAFDLGGTVRITVTQPTTDDAS